MKNIAFKSLFLVSTIFFIDYGIMMVIGLVSYYLGCSSDFYDFTYCTIGKVLIAASVILFITALILEIKSLVIRKK